MTTVNELYGNDTSLYDYLIEGVEEKNKKIKELKNMSFNEKQFAIFKMYYDGLCNSDKDIIKTVVKRNPFILMKMDSLIEEANLASVYKSDSLYNREKACPEIMAQYNLLINKILVLAKELGISNSLEICVLYSYLLWNGFLSKNKTNVFKSEGRKFIWGLLFADIMDGIGVCLNHADMLRDILNASGYTSIILENSFNEHSTINYKIGIEIKGMTDDIARPFSEKLFRKRKANHAFNLIEENDKIYIYDSTNLLLHKLMNSSYCELVNGKGKSELFPYQSYSFVNSKEEEKLLDRLFTDDKFISPYTRSDFVSVCEVNLEMIKNSISLFEDFYSDVRPNIIGISEETDKIVKKRKR